MLQGVSGLTFVASSVSPEEALAAAATSDLGNGFQRVYGEASPVSSYGGMGGGEGAASNRFRYMYDVPSSWSSGTVGKIEKAYSGVDTKFKDQRTKSSAYVITLAGYTALKSDRRSILDDLSLSDSSLQDSLQSEDIDVSLSEVTAYPDGKTAQPYVYFDLSSPSEHALATITSDGVRLFALFTRTNPSTFKRDPDTFYSIQNSLATIPLAEGG